MLLPVKAALVLAPVILVAVLAHGGLHGSPQIVTFVAQPLAIALGVALFALYTRKVEARGHGTGAHASAGGSRSDFCSGC